MTERLCIKCNETKPIELFVRGKRTCKKCKAEYDKKWREANAEHVAEQARQIYQNPERRQKQRESSVRSYHNNRDNRLANRRDYVANNPEKVKAVNAVSEQRRRARINNLPPDQIESVDRIKVCERDKWQCQLPKCYAQSRKIDKRLKHPDPWSGSVDHIIPLKDGGPHTYANVQAAHLHCNHRKNHTGGGDQMALFGGV